MPQSFFPDRILDRPLRQFPALWSNWFSTPLASLFEEESWPTLKEIHGARVYEEKDNLHVELPLPGLSADDIEVSLKKGVLIVKGECKEEEKQEDKEKKGEKRKYYRFSRRSYSYSFALPTQIDEKQEPQACYDNGVLNICLKLAKPAETKKISVKATKKNK